MTLEKRCTNCRGLLLKVVESWVIYFLESLSGHLFEIKCRKCKTINKI